MHANASHASTQYKMTSQHLGKPLCAHYTMSAKSLGAVFDKPISSFQQDSPTLHVQAHDGVLSLVLYPQGVSSSSTLRSSTNKLAAANHRIIITVLDQTGAAPNRTGQGSKWSWISGINVHTLQDCTPHLGSWTSFCSGCQGMTACQLQSPGTAPPVKMMHWSALFSCSFPQLDSSNSLLYSLLTLCTCWQTPQSWKCWSKICEWGKAVWLYHCSVL